VQVEERLHMVVDARHQMVGQILSAVADIDPGKFQPRQ
jgi:ribosomal protein L13